MFLSSNVGLSSTQYISSYHHKLLYSVSIIFVYSCNMLGRRGGFITALIFALDSTMTYPWRPGISVTEGIAVFVSVVYLVNFFYRYVVIVPINQLTVGCRFDLHRKGQSPSKGLFVDEYVLQLINSRRWVFVFDDPSLFSIKRFHRFT